MGLDDFHPSDNGPDAGADEALDAIVAEYVAAVERGERLDRPDWLARHPRHAAELLAFFEDYDRFGRLSQPLPPDVLDPYNLVGTRLGDYEIEEQVARGGMGAVFLARQVSVGRRVALKLVLGGRLASAEERQRFQGEAMTAARLDHPGIVKVFDVGEVDGRPYYTMPYIDAGSLAQRAAEYRDDPRRAAGLVSKVARAVHFANDAGILHRDVKPSNILIDARGEPWLADFGLAKAAGSTSDITRTGAVLGTAEYIAPELTRGEKQPPTRAADIYSIGAVLYELLAGSPPFRGATPLETLDLARRAEAVPPRRRSPRVPRDLETVCLKCLEKEPRRRYATARELADDLDRFLKGEPIAARPSPRWERLVKWSLRHPAVSSACLVALVGLVVVACLGIRYNLRLRSALDDSRRHVYLSTMRLAYEAAGDGRLGELETMLEATRPAPGEEDLRSLDWYALQRFAGARRWSLVHPAPLDMVVFHPTRLVLACAGRDGTVYVWDLEAEKLAARLEVSTYPVKALAFSSDGSLLGAAGMTPGMARDSQPVTVWRWERGEKVLELADTPWRIVGLSFDPAGERLVVCGADRMEVRSLDGGASEATVRGKASFILFAASRGARELAVAYPYKTKELFLHDLKTGEALPSLPLALADCRSLAITEDGAWLAQGLPRGQAYLVRVGEEGETPLAGLQDTVGALSFSRDGRLLAAGSRATRRGGQLSIHDVPSGRLRSRVQAHYGSVASVAFSSAGDHVATCGEDAEARVWSVGALDLLENQALAAGGRSVAFARSGAALAMADAKSNVTVLDARSGARKAARSGARKAAWRSPGAVGALAFSPDEEVLACGSARKVKIWSVTGVTKLAELPGHRGRVRRLQFDPGGRMLAVGSYAQIKVWDVPSWREAASFAPHACRVSGLAFTSESGRIFSAGRDGRVVSTVVGSWTSSLLAELPAIVDLALSPDEESLALACEDGRVRVVGAMDGRIIAELVGHEGPVHGVAFSHDGKLIASVASDRTLRLWDRALARERAILQSGDSLQQIAFGHEDELLAAVSFGSTVSFVRAARGVSEPRTLFAAPEALRAGGSSMELPPIRWRKVEARILAERGSSQGAAWGDYDADGDPDIYTLRYGPHQLLRNDGAGSFEAVRGSALRTEGRGTSASWGDADGDGDLDLFVGYEHAPGQLLRNDGGELQAVESEAFRAVGTFFAAWGDLDGDTDLDLYTVDRNRARLLRNDGTAFADATPAEIGTLAGSETATLLDLDGDGDLDIFAGRQSADPGFYANEGSFRFRREYAPFAWEPRQFDALSWSDWEGDGDMDCVVAVRAKSDRSTRVVIDEIILYLNQGQGRFREATGRLLQVEDKVLGLAWGDFDLDGDADLFVARDDGRTTLLSHGDNGLEVDTASGLPEVLGTSVTSATWVDHDVDGDLDLFFTDFDGSSSLFENRQEGGHYLAVRLEGRPPNRHAVGATVRIQAGGRSQTRMLAALETRGAGHSLPLHFGLGEAASVDRLVVRWPRGDIQVLRDVPADQTLVIKEEESAVPARVMAIRSLGGSATLDGAAALPPGAPAEPARVRWEKVDGLPGDAIEDAGKLVTHVRFSASGRYTYELVGEADKQPHLRLTVPVAPVGVEVHAERRPAIDLLEVPVAGDADFDPVDPDVLHVGSDTRQGKGGSIQTFRLGPNGPLLEETAAADYPGAVVVGREGQVWFAMDSPTGSGVPLARLGAPAGGSPPMAEVAIAAFAGLENAKPTALAVVPPGFQSPRAAPGDVLIGLSWPGGGKVPVIGRYTPSAAGGDPNVHTAIAEAPGLGSEWKGLRLGAIDFAPDGSSVYVLPHAKDFFLELDPAFELRKRVVPGGAELKKLDTLAVSPRDGRLWVGEDARDEVWSLDPVTFEARLEFTFIKEGVQDGMGQAVDFHPPTMRFSRDGRRLVMSDVNGWVWVLGWY